MSEEKWETYEEVAAYLLNNFASEFNLDLVEGKQKVPGNRSGTKWEIDGKGIKKNGEGFLIIECRRYTTSKQNQEKMAGLAYRIIDSGAAGGIIVSPLGLQSGAELVAETENVVNVKLNPESTTKEYILEFLNKVMIGVFDEVKLGITDSVHFKII